MNEQQPPKRAANNQGDGDAEVARLASVQKQLNRLLPLPWGCMITLAVGLVAMLLYVLTLDAKIRWGVFGLLTVYAAAAVAVGALFGFLFGVPRVISGAHAGECWQTPTLSRSRIGSPRCSSGNPHAAWAHPFRGEQSF
jgi:hypothetical protein